ncbi:MAG: serpin family protein [Anaerolineae bacterium]|nr:serpin family protein [Anaerolineae bacterium]
MKTFLGVFRWMLLGALVIAACAPQKVNAAVAMSEKPRLKDPQVSPEDLLVLAQDNAAFALDLYQVLRLQDGNLFYSPYSISTALAMTYAGAMGQTADQMSQALHFSLPPERLHPAFNALALDLAARPEQAGGDVKTPFELSVANALWGQKDFQFLPEFLDLLAQNYGAGMRLVNFSEDAEGSRRIINQWVSDQTRARIQDLLPPGSLDAMTRLVLTNAIYFKAGWLHQFEKESTRPAPFYLLDGSTVQAQTMRLNKPFGYAILENARALELPYEGGGVSMLLLLPDEGQFQAVEARLDGDLLGELQQNWQYGSVDLALPKFTFESQFDLNQALSGLGMADAFNASQADFSGMTGNRELYISSVVHKAFVAVDETGTEAAAATAVIMGATAAMPQEPVIFHFDRPFIFLIRDNQTGSILFAGRVLDPTR